MDRIIEISQTINDAIEPLNAFNQILMDLSCPESIEGTMHLYHLSIINDLVIKNTMEKIEELQKLNSFNATESADTAKQGAESTE